MSDYQSLEGSCLCGAITLSATKANNSCGACHCGTCRKWGGGPFMTIDCHDSVTIEGKDALGIYDSSQWAERGFCTRCGTHLFYRLKDRPQYHVALGLFGDSVSPTFAVQVFIDKKPDFYAFANETKELTEQQIFDMYAPKS